MPWSDMIRMRNIAAHHYLKFDLVRLWGTIIEDIPKLKLFCQKMIPELEKDSSPQPEFTSKPRP
jgi:uncharacterized protein with HEPN domain